MLGRNKPDDTPPSTAPILACDIDGVISLFGFEEGTTTPPGKFHLIDGMLHCISMPVGERLQRLGLIYELIWASGWEDRANFSLPLILGLPELPYLTFGGKARFGTAHWKLESLDAYAGERPLAWIDDSLDASCYDWAAARNAPTLLVPTDSAIGLEEGHVAVLEDWARAGYQPR